jgi:hypothetical protein
MGKYIIDIDSERSDWEIIKEGYDRRSGKIPKDIIFAKERIDKNGKLLWVFDAGFLDEYSEKPKTKKRFKEVAEFTVVIDEKEKGKFTGTFLDALEYVKKFWRAN